MNVTMNRLLLLVVILISSIGLNAQTSSFDDVLSVQLRNMGPILENNQVKGYFMFYKVDKVDRKTNAYMLRILDENLREISKKKIIKPKNTSLSEAVYNGNAFLFSFIDLKKKKLQLVTYDKEMKKLGSRNYELDKTGMSQYKGSAALNAQGKGDEASSNNLIFSIGDQGFVRYNLVKNKKMGFETEFLPNDLKRAGSWVNASPKDSKMIKASSFGDASNKYLATVITTKPRKLSNKDLVFSLQLLDMETRKVVFEKPLKSKRYAYTFMNAIINEDEKSIMVFGEYFDQGENIFKSKSSGLYALELDMTGEVIKETLHSWKGQIDKMVGVDKKGRIEDGGYVAFHKIVQSSDGHFYAIGEMYKKSASAVGIASQLLSRGGGASVMKLVLLDLVIFDFNPDLSLNDVIIFDKKKVDVHLPSGYGHLPPTLLANYLRAFSNFDYAYTQVKPDKSSFFTTYVSVEEEAGEVKDNERSKKKKKKKKRKPYFGIIALTEGDDDFVVDKIDLSNDASWISVSPAKAGYIMITEYYKKEKRMDSRLEKINY